MSDAEQKNGCGPECGCEDKGDPKESTSQTLKLIEAVGKKRAVEILIHGLSEVAEILGGTAVIAVLADGFLLTDYTGDPIAALGLLSVCDREIHAQLEAPDDEPE